MAISIEDYKLWSSRPCDNIVVFLLYFILYGLNGNETLSSERSIGTYRYTVFTRSVCRQFTSKIPTRPGRKTDNIILCRYG